MTSTEYDVIVMGGGPAGSTVATLVAQAGRRVLLLERSPAPRFKVGESLMPATYWTLRRLGMLEKMKASHFPRKYSVQFYGKSGRASSPFYFQETDPGESSITWQVLRSEFDGMLLANAREQGVEVRMGTGVREVLFDGERAVGVLAEEADGGRREIRSRVVVDATGRNALLAKRFGLRRPDPGLKKAAVWSHFEGALRDPGIDEGATLVLHTEEQRSWFWYIPLPGDRVSVGAVGSIEYLIAGRDPDPQKVFDEEVARCAEIGRRLAGARQALPIQTTSDFSYRSARIAGDGWVLAGDAFGFLDPIYSSGVFLALASGELAADSVVAALAADDLSGARLGAHGPRLADGMDAMRRLVYAYYDPNFSFSKFLRRFPECRLDIINLLVGNVFREPVDGLYEALEEMCAPPPPSPRLEAPAASMPSTAVPAVPEVAR